MNSSNQIKRRGPRAGSVLNRLADRIDLAVDLLTLGQYGLERVADDCAATASCEPRSQRRSRRRGDCTPAAAISWDWPSARGDAAAR